MTLGVMETRGMTHLRDISRSLYYRDVAPRYPTGVDVPDAHLLHLWRERFDTFDIACICQITEAEVAKRLPRIRQRARQDAEWNFDRIAEAR